LQYVAPAHYSFNRLLAVLGGGLPMLQNGDFYGRIRSRNQQWWGEKRFEIATRLGRDLHIGALDLLAEFVQNAEDAGAERLALRVLEEGLLVWNDGRPFEDKDIESIAGIFVTSKDASAIGYFGIGFKATLSVTDNPCILSGKHCFWLKQGLDPYPLTYDKAEDAPNVPSEAWELFNRFCNSSGAIFWLPWRQRFNVDQFKNELINQREKLGEFLLFMNKLRLLQVNGETWEVQRERDSSEQDIVWITLTSSDGKTEHFLRIDWREIMAQEVVEEIASEMDEWSRNKWLNSTHRFQFSFLLRVNRDRQKIEEIETGRVFVFLPTNQETGFRFHIQGRFALTADRKRVKENDPMTQWALGILKEKVCALPVILRDLGLLPSAWRIFPKEDEADSLMKKVSDALRRTLQEGEFFPGDDGNFYRKDQVCLAHRMELYDLLCADELSEVSGRKVRWVHPELRRGRASEIAQSLGVEIIDRDHILRWLEAKGDPTWWEQRPKNWLRKLYQYLEEIKRSREDWKLKWILQSLPIVRLQNGKHVLPNTAVLPSKDEAKIPEKLLSEINKLNIVDKNLAKDFRELFISLGVTDFHIELLFDRLIKSRYSGDIYPTSEENFEHILLMYNFRDQISSNCLQRWGHNFRILRDKQGNYVKPSEAYLPREIGGYQEVEDYFQMLGGRPFVSPEYLDYLSDNERNDEEIIKSWIIFLQKLGVSELPRIYPKSKKLEYNEINQWCKEHNINLDEHPYSTRDYIGIDMTFDGIEEILDLWEQKTPDLQEVLRVWNVSKLIIDQYTSVKGAGGSEYYLYSTKSAFTWFYYTGHYREGTASWLIRLRTIPWLPDERGNFRRPSELFNSNLKKVLGEKDFSFLHPIISLESSQDQKWAKLLGIRMDASPEDVIQALKTKLDHGANQEEIKPIYEWLQKTFRSGNENLKESIREAFGKEKLILVPERGRFDRQEVCWDDPTGLMPALKPYWSDLRQFFCEFLRVAESPTVDVLAKFLVESLKQQKDPEQWKEIALEVQRRWKEVPDDLKEELKQVKWPGQRNRQVKWAFPERLCLKDNRRLISRFEGKIIWWNLESLKELAQNLGVGSLSEAKPQIQKKEQNEDSNVLELKSELERIWPAIRWIAGVSEENPPDIRKAQWIKVSYHWRGIESEPKEVNAILENSDSRVLWVTSQADSHDIGNALEEGLGQDRLREFIKDIWKKEKDELKRNLERWIEEVNSSKEKLFQILQEIEEKEKYKQISTKEDNTKILYSPQRHHDSSKIHINTISPIGTKKEQTETIEQIEDYTPQIELEQPDLETARIAEEKAKEWFKQEGFEVKDVSKDNLGYDLEINRNYEVYFVEVKGCKRQHDVVLTKNEWEVAKEKKEQYWLFIYVCDEDTAYIIKNPTNKLEPYKYMIKSDEWINKADDEIRFYIEAKEG